MNKTIFKRFIFLFALYFLGVGGSVFLGQISCQDKGDGCPDDSHDEKGACVCDEGYEEGVSEGDMECVESPDDATDPADVTCADYISDNFSVYSFSADYCICVGTDTSWCPLGDSTTATTETSIADALTTRSTITDTVVIILNEQTFDEAISLTNSSDSNTYFIGRGGSASTTITYSSPTSVTDNVIEMDSNVSTIGFYNLTIDGIGSEVTPLDSIDNLDAATVSIANTNSVTFHDVTFTDNYFRALYITGSSSLVSLQSVDLESFIPGTGDYETTIGIWNEGSLTTAEDYALSIQDSSVYVGIISTQTGNQLNLDGYLSDNTQVASMLLYDSSSITLEQINIIDDNIGIYSEDVESFTLDGNSGDGYSTLSGPTFGLVGCQTNSLASASNSTYTFIDNTRGSIDNLYFAKVTVNGSGNTDSVFDNVNTTSSTNFTATTITEDGSHSYSCDVSEYY